MTETDLDSTMPLFGYYCTYCYELIDLHNTPVLQVKDNMFKGGKHYPYIICPSCRSWHQTICEVKEEDSYPEKYYTKADVRVTATYLEKKWAEYSAGDGNLLGRLVALIKDGKHTTVEAVVNAAPDKNTRILDFGCGNGLLVRMLRSLGYKNTIGYDPFLKSDNYVDGLYKNLTRIYYEHSKMDLVVSCHTIEHLHYPGSLLDIAKVLEADKLIIQCPISDGFPGTPIFGVNWVGLDAPRHLHIPSDKGLKALLTKSPNWTKERYRVIKEYSNTTMYSFVASEFSKSNVPWTSLRAKLLSLPSRAFFDILFYISNYLTESPDIYEVDDMKTYICERSTNEPTDASACSTPSSEQTPGGVS